MIIAESLGRQRTRCCAGAQSFGIGGKARRGDDEAAGGSLERDDAIEFAHGGVKFVIDATMTIA